MIEEKKYSLYSGDIIDFVSAETIFPTGNMFSTIFSPYLSKMTKKSNPVLRCKLDRFKKIFNINSDILDKVKDYLIEGNVFLAGGKMIDFFNNKMSSESTNDYDIFSTSEHTISIIKEKLEKLKFNVVTDLVYISEYIDENIKIQLVNNEFASAEDVIENFDIRACAICTDGVYVYWVKKCLHDIRDKTIVMLNPRPNMLSMARIIKYAQKGYEVKVPDLIIASINLLDHACTFQSERQLFDRSFVYDRLFNGYMFNEE